MKNRLILLIIIILAAVLRLWQLGQVPPGATWDEVALGYNAYSIMQTGKDEYGKSFPVVLESFGDYKPALYTYLIIPFLPLFDLTVLAVRLPAALIGIFAVLLTYFLAKELFKRTDIALLSTFLLAVSPWHIQMTRVAFESGVGMAFNLAGIVFFLKGLRKPLLLSLSAAFFSLSIYTYQSDKLFVPLLLIVLIAVYWKKLFTLQKKYIILAVVSLIVISFPITYFTFTNQNGLARAKGVSFFGDTYSLLYDNVRMIQRDKQDNYLLGEIFDNRRVTFVKTVISEYLFHFDLNWWFITGDSINRHHVPLMALMYITELPFLLIGFYLLFFKKYVNISLKSRLLILLWILITPIPASFTIDVPHAVRTLNFLPAFQLVIALGAFTFIKYISRGKYQIAKIKIKYAVFTLLLLCSVCNFTLYINQYFVQQNYFYAKDWLYGYEELVDFITPIQHKYKKIVISNRGYMMSSYMFFLFFQKYDPSKYLAEGGTRISGIEKNGNRFSNFEFRNYNYYDEKNTPMLLIGTDLDFNEEFKVIKRIKFPDGTDALRVVEKI